MRPGRVLAARLDSAGDVLLCGPAVRALARHAGPVVFLCGPRGRAAAELLPGVAEIVEYHAPWVDLEPPELTEEAITALIDRLRALDLDEAVVFTSFHQSPLPLALVLRMAGVRRISAISVDYPGSLLDVRHLVDDDIPEPERALSLAAAAGFTPDPQDDGRLRIRPALPDIRGLAGEPGYVVLHPGAAVPARRMSAARSRSAAAPRRAPRAPGRGTRAPGGPGNTPPGAGGPRPAHGG
ncbi:glycosyltransferase family 9 protein, partial [Nocardia wallacei]|uniref:glycosyltransferase family 9 protein n=1 Tax=Nocardia wallacei TaxID=480035 RepID=UPI003CC7EFF4